MNATDIRSPWARFAFVTLSVFWASAGWFVLLNGGFHKTFKYSSDTTFVDGAGASFVALVFILLSALSAAIFLRSVGAKVTAFLVPAVIVFLPACVYLVAKATTNYVG